MKVVVSGGKGFIGRAVKAHLEEAGFEAVSYDLPDDVRDFDNLKRVTEGADAFIHMAGVLGTHELFDTIDLAIDVNIKGTVNVLEACRVNGLSFVGITMPQVFKSIYTATKVCTGWIASGFNQTYGLPVSHVRAFNAFGPGQAHGPGHPQKIVPTFAVEAWAGRPIPIWGDGEQSVDLIHTSDLGRMLVDATRHSMAERVWNSPSMRLPIWCSKLLVPRLESSIFRCVVVSVQLTSSLRERIGTCLGGSQSSGQSSSSRPSSGIATSTSRTDNG
jgi:UDP-glucose 4-epimerase